MGMEEATKIIYNIISYKFLFASWLLLSERISPPIIVGNAEDDRAEKAKVFGFSLQSQFSYFALVNSFSDIIISSQSMS